MIKLISRGEYNTSRGKAFVVEPSDLIRVGELIEINGEQYRIDRTCVSSQPTKERLVGLFVKPV